MSLFYLNVVVIVFIVFSSILFVNKIECCIKSNWNPLIQRNHITALILARGGSKGIRLKNLAKIGGETLLTKSIRVIQDSRVFDSIWVSTDHELIAKQAETDGALVHWRAKYTATDEAKSIVAVQEFIQYHPEIDIIALIQCTSPFLNRDKLQEAVALFKFKPELSCVFSATRHYKLLWVKTLNGLVKPLNFNVWNRPRRQNWNGQYMENGMFYFAKRKLIELGTFQTEK